LSYASKPGDEIAPGVTLIDTAGHTPGHVSVLLNSGGNQLLIGGDVLNQSVVSFAKPDWRWGADMDPELAIAARKRTLDMLATDRISLLGYHLPWPGLGRVERKDTAFRFIAG
jgi:glyoxylase-like metal-dependent hydrolase (beta-lactamase superfamily II)